VLLQDPEKLKQQLDAELDRYMGAAQAKPSSSIANDFNIDV